MVEKKKKNNRFIVLMGFGLQMGVTIYLGAALGRFLDAKYPMDKNWFTIAFTILALIISFYNLLRQVNKLNEKSD